MKPPLLTCTLLLAAALARAAEPGAAGRIQYPPTRRVEHVDTYFGVKVPDPYRWLEARHPQLEGGGRLGGRRKQADVRPTWRRSPQREAIRRRLTELWNFPQYSVAFKAGGRYYFLKNDGLQNQPVLYVHRFARTASPACCLDPNTWSKDGTIALGGMGFSDDGR